MFLLRRVAVHKEVLVEAPVNPAARSRGTPSAPQRRNLVAGGEQAAGAVAHVAGPHEVVAFVRVVARLPPGDAERGDEGAVVDICPRGPSGRSGSSGRGGRCRRSPRPRRHEPLLRGLPLGEEGVEVVRAAGAGHRARGGRAPSAPRGAAHEGACSGSRRRRARGQTRFPSRCRAARSTAMLLFCALVELPVHEDGWFPGRSLPFKSCQPSVAHHDGRRSTEEGLGGPERAF